MAWQAEETMYRQTASRLIRRLQEDQAIPMVIVFVQKLRPARRWAGILWSLLTVMAAVSEGCAVVRYADYALPAIRFDRPNNRPLPPADAPQVAEAIAAWRNLSEDQRAQFPTPYHVYVDAPDPGAFEGDYTVGLAFSGGGTRGTVFTAACVRELANLGPIHVDSKDGAREIDLIHEVDYVSGVSTGAIPAALFALSFGERCPPRMRLERWPDCFNVDVRSVFLGRLPARPDLLLRDLSVGMNTRAALSGAIAAAFFGGKPNRPSSGLTFGDLPRCPVLIVGATIINDPGVPFMETRLPYRFALNQSLEYPWQATIQSFESLHSDPLSYPLGEAAYDSSSFPGHIRSGLAKVQPDQPWVYEGLDSTTAARMRAARTQLGYEGVYDIKDGGLVDNRGSYIIHRLYRHLAQDNPPAHKPLLISLDAGFLELRPPRKGSGVLKKGWMDELESSMRSSWQTGQDAYNELIEATASQGAYDYVRFRLTAWVHFMASESEVDDSPEAAYLVRLCKEEPLIQTPENLLQVLRQVGTTFTDLKPDQLAAAKLCARFAVWLQRDRLLRWASGLYGGAPAAFSRE